ncbi:hypothetical protein A0H81_07585 [Grifola frondosa]|uniref:Uncharacterized protein n=1 Tax=Grifola frondosa TaxID=5627 RepID=A0A1C7M6R7_GRIFR|nr:hypothetical protein A0H81_07585 [Grifola frondosa]
MAPNSRPTATAAHPQASANRANIHRYSVPYTISLKRGFDRSIATAAIAATPLSEGLPPRCPLISLSTNQRVYIQILPGVWIEGIIAGMCNQYAGAAYDVEYTASDGRRKTDRFAPYNIRAAN